MRREQHRRWGAAGPAPATDDAARLVGAAHLTDAARRVGVARLVGVARPKPTGRGGKGWAGR